jgi:hypothetical protein
MTKPYLQEYEKGCKDTEDKILELLNKHNYYDDRTIWDDEERPITALIKELSSQEVKE